MNIIERRRPTPKRENLGLIANFGVFEVLSVIKQLTFEENQNEEALVLSEG